MTPPPIPKRPRSTRIPVAVWIALALILLAAGGVVTTLAWFRLSNDAAVRNLESAARARGEPVTLSDLATNYPAIPDSENAAVLLMDLWEKEDPQYWKAFRTGIRPLPEKTPVIYDPDLPLLGSKTNRTTGRDVLPPERRTALELFVSTNQVRTAAVQEALKGRPKVRFPVRVTDGVGALLPHLAWMKTESQYLRLETILAIERGDATGAIDCLQRSQRLDTALKDEPFLISNLVRIAVQTAILIECERLMSRQILGEAELERLSTIVQSLGMRDALKRSFIAERASALSVYEMSESTLRAIELTPGTSDEEPVNPAHAQFGIKLLNLTGIVSADRRFLLETLGRAIELSDQDTPASLAQIDDIFDQVDRQGLGFPPKFISALMLPSLKRVAPKFAALEARRRSGLVAISIERFRLKNGNRLPVQLEELVPEYLAKVPADPFDGKPLRYRLMEKGFVVYSVGADRGDHLGRERPTRGRIGEFDETFLVER